MRLLMELAVVLRSEHRHSRHSPSPPTTHPTHPTHPTHAPHAPHPPLPLSSPPPASPFAGRALWNTKDSSCFLLPKHIAVAGCPTQLTTAHRNCSIQRTVDSAHGARFSLLDSPVPGLHSAILLFEKASDIRTAAHFRPGPPASQQRARRENSPYPNQPTTKLELTKPPSQLSFAKGAHDDTGWLCCDHRRFGHQPKADDSVNSRQHIRTEEVTI
ncbi:hypothetical protein SODALDRAFT_360505 [Sodiomyces alkalinus F11]|uniref:Uncharacterized protein n=1 Tax=Sodiomyces alkalinus (strain CBS 110278 / VKM F-3762 / F11) TaxID=1314773 RepID=A0A3N2PUI2_SODAK|nr:hypothetical protein SODALDRAFT_360505 [Sodiomyces alkalinus F11]ROT38165.1 hypothetical protein SODALDRAFT_360505 [Sodiomyces alkalinus F11]